VSPLEQSSDVLASVYDAALFDLDGVIYIGPQAVPGVVPVVNEMAQKFGMTMTYVTNNASRSAESVAEHLRELGLDVGAADVVTSAQAGAAELAKRVPAGSSVFCMGSRDLMREVELVGLVPSQDPDLQHVAVIEGYWPDMPWRMLAQGAKVLSTGALWVATNMDMTIPTQWGTSPGNGSMVTILGNAIGRAPDVVAGKPEVPLMQQSIDRAHAQRPIVFGDRLDTDIWGANNVGIDSVCVLSGVTTVRELCDAPVHLRPTYIAWDATCLAEPQQAVKVTGDEIRSGEVSWHRDGFTGAGDALDAIRVGIAAVWHDRATTEQVCTALSARGIAVG
jgi:HAD superfamily hydrolase (TIGR01450 family)